MSKKSKSRALIHALIPEKKWEEIRKPIISAFLIFNLALILTYFARPAPVTNKVFDTFRTYFWFVGLAQDYGVFAPSPTQNNLHFIALVTYDDGSTRLYTFPRLNRLPLSEKLFKERYRKFLDDNASMEPFSFLRKDIAAYVSRQCDVFSDIHPKIVSLIRFSSIVPPFQDANSPNTKKGGPGVFSYGIGSETRYFAAPNPPQTDMQVLGTYDVSELREQHR